MKNLVRLYTLTVLLTGFLLVQLNATQNISVTAESVSSEVTEKKVADKLSKKGKKEEKVVVEEEE